MLHKERSLKTPHIICLALLTLSLIFACCYAHALAKTNEDTENDKTVFAFFTLSNSQPDFESWIKGTNHYKGTPFSNRKPLLAEETKALTAGFNEYKSRPQAIFIEKNARIIVQNNTSTQQADEETTSPSRTLNFKIMDVEESEIPFFNIPYGEESIALIVEQINEFSQTPIDNQKHEQIKQYFFDDTLYTGKIELQLRPISADHTNPLIVNNKERWLMLADIAALRLTFYDRYKETEIEILSYTAPWYKTAAQED